VVKSRLKGLQVQFEDALAGAAATGSGGLLAVVQALRPTALIGV
jgi:hypothetical protein